MCSIHTKHSYAQKTHTNRHETIHKRTTAYFYENGSDIKSKHLTNCFKLGDSVARNKLKKI